MIQQIQEFLDLDPKRAIDVYTTDNVKLGVKITTDKLTDFGGLKNYLLKLQEQNPNLQQVFIQKYLPNGKNGETNNYKRHNSMPSNVFFKKATDNSLGSEEAVKSAATQQVAAPPVFSQPNIPIQQIHQPLNYGNNQGMNGMLAVHLKAEKYEFLYEKHAELKDDYRELKQDHKQLQKKHIEAKSRISNFEKERDLDRRITEASVKKLDAAELIEKATPLLAGAMESFSKSNVVAATTGLAGVDVTQYSKNKKQLLELILDEQFTDKDCFDMVAIFTGKKIKPDTYAIELQALNDLHAINKTIQ